MYRCIGEISNYYGGVVIKEEGDKFLWAIDNWEEIPKYLYEALNKHQDELELKEKQK